MVRHRGEQPGEFTLPSQFRDGLVDRVAPDSAETYAEKSLPAGSFLAGALFVLELVREGVYFSTTLPTDGKGSE